MSTKTTPAPSDEAKKMKREQEQAVADNIIKLLGKRNGIRAELEQVNADLTHVGYVPPESAPMPKRLTEAEWNALLDVNGKIIVAKGKIHAMEQDIDALLDEKAAAIARNIKYKNQIEKLQAKAKPAKKSAKKK